MYFTLWRTISALHQPLLGFNCHIQYDEQTLSLQFNDNKNVYCCLILLIAFGIFYFISNGNLLQRFFAMFHLVL